MKVIFIMANNSSVPYFNWFAEYSKTRPDVEMSFVAMFPTRPLMLDEMKQQGLKCNWIYFNSEKRKRSMITSFFTLLKLFRKLKPDVVHVHLFDDSVPGLIAAWLTRVPVRVITKQDTTFHYYFTPKWIWVDKLNNMLATHIHAVSNPSMQFIIEKENAPKQKVHLIRNGFPINIITNYSESGISFIKKRYDLDGFIVVGTVARLIDWKGHKIIIKAAIELVKEFPSLKFLWAGTGSEEYKKELQSIIINSGLQNNIFFTDWLERELMPSFYKCLDIYLHPAINEPFGFAISEAMMNEIPIAACPTGSVDLVCHLKEGYILEQGNDKSIIEAIKFYLLNPEKRKLIATAGKDHSFKFLAFSRMAEEHFALYRKAITIKSKLK